MTRTEHAAAHCAGNSQPHHGCTHSDGGGNRFPHRGRSKLPSALPFICTLTTTTTTTITFLLSPFFLLSCSVHRSQVPFCLCRFFSFLCVTFFSPFLSLSLCLFTLLCHALYQHSSPCSPHHNCPNRMDASSCIVLSTPNLHTKQDQIFICLDSPAPPHCVCPQPRAARACS